MTAFHSALLNSLQDYHYPSKHLSLNISQHFYQCKHHHGTSVHFYNVSVTRVSSNSSSFVLGQVSAQYVYMYMFIARFRLPTIKSQRTFLFLIIFVYSTVGFKFSCVTSSGILHISIFHFLEYCWRFATPFSRL